AARDQRSLAASTYDAARARSLSRALFEDRRRVDLVLAPDDGRRRADGDPLASPGGGVWARGVGPARRPAGIGLSHRGRGRAGVPRRLGAPRRRRCVTLV